jgi:hypothetical protein
LVTLNLEYPVAKAMSLLGEAVDKEQKKHENKEAGRQAQVEKDKPEKSDAK